MFSLRNGSLPANALLIAIGAAAGSGVTVLVSPLFKQNPAGGSSDRNPQSLVRSSSGSRDLAPVVSISAAAGIMDAAQRSEAFRQVGARAARRDPARALRQAAGLASEQDKLDFMRGIYAEWSAGDPVAALDYAKTSLPAGLMRNEVVGIAVNKWAAMDPRAAWLWAGENLTGPLREQAFNDVLIGWTRRTPDAAARWLSSAGVKSQPLVSAVARTWAEQDPQSAVAWAEGQPDKEVRQTAVVSSAAQWLAQQPQEAAQHFTREVSQPDGAVLATAIADIWGTTDPAATAEWISGLPASPGRDEAAATLATVWAASDIEAAVKWCATLTDADARRQVITHIGTTWGAIEPDRAINWLSSLPVSMAADGMIGAYNSWAATDATGLREWLEASPPAPEMDVARTALAEVLSDSDILASMDLAFQLSSATHRDNAIARYYRHWNRADEAEARAWLEQNWNTLESSTRQRLTAEQRRIARK